MRDRRKEEVLLALEYSDRAGLAERSIEAELDHAEFLQGFDEAAQRFPRRLQVIA